DRRGCDARGRRRDIGAWRHDAQQLIDFDLIRVREIVPGGDVAIVLAVLERDPIERVARLHAVVARRRRTERHRWLSAWRTERGGAVDDRSLIEPRRAGRQ